MQQMAISPVQSWGKSFRELCCERLGCDLDSFEDEVFWRSLHLHSIPLAYFIYRKNPMFFREDFEFLHEIGGVQDPDTFKSELNRFHGRNVRDKSWFRRTFSIRISGKRLIRFKNRMLNLGRFAEN